MQHDLNIACLEVDEPSKQAGRFISAIWPGRMQPVFLTPPDNLNPATREYITASTKNVCTLKGRVLTIYGSGSFHHYTYGLVKNLANTRSENYAYVHIDQHTDNGSPESPYLGNGGFVGQIGLEKSIAAVRYIGCEQILNKETPAAIILQNKTINEDGVQKTLQDILAGTPDDVYVSIDLDVLKKNEMITRWEEGLMGINTLIEVIQFLIQKKNIISADILGHGSYWMPGDVDRRPSISDAVHGKIKRLNLIVYAMVAGTFLGDDVSIWKQEHTDLAAQNLNNYLNS
ncbi:arginase family protein [Candidatus Woesearchaeota archaeon]|nr:arginase family protein [Candidatus Woesearchaeota archaeon]